ncbi:CCR4-NOT transcription complex subunit 2 [Nymphon striatum]|nr:CCR4-NOT transcription complex subunit 2 [Nymphon striatum]
MKKSSSDLSPGSRKNINHLASIPKPKKNFYNEEEDGETPNPELYFNQFNKDNVATSSTVAQAFSSSLYGQPVNTSLSGMNSLGLQQPPRSAPNSSSHSGFGTGPNIGSRLVTSVVGAPGHVTPTNSIGSIGMNLPSNNSFSAGLPSSGTLPSSVGSQQQQSSPNSRSIIAMPTSRGILGQRQVGGPINSSNNEMKRTGLNIGISFSGNTLSNMSSMGFGMPNHGSRFNASQNMISGLQTSMSSAFSANAAIDLSEFPSLSNRGGRGDSGSTTPNMSSSLMSGRPPYVGMVKQPVSESSEFQIHSEDFPALPGSQGLPEGVNCNTNNNDLSLKNPISYSIDNAKDIPGRISSEKNTVSGPKIGIHTSSDGVVSNIPAGMVTDQFGMVGLLTFIRAAETDPNLVTLALGSDLTTLGLNLNSAEDLYPSFGGPWADHPCRPQDIDYHVPQEYLTNIAIRDKLAAVKLNRYGEDLLFYIFYTNGGDILQVAAAAEFLIYPCFLLKCCKLRFNREWRYHKEEQVWITRAPGMTPTEKTSSYERGTYYFFDPHNWRKVAKEFHLEYNKLEERPHMPPKMSSSIA